MIFLIFLHNYYYPHRSTDSILTLIQFNHAFDQSSDLMVRMLIPKIWSYQEIRHICITYQIS
jgi:hypothetical protein